MLKKIKFEYNLLDFISSLLGWSVASLLWLLMTHPAVASNSSTSTVSYIANFSPMLIISAIIGAVGGYLSFGEDKKFPPSAASIGHVLLGFGAGLFLTRGSLELFGHSNSSEDVIIFTSFMWSTAGYFLLRMIVVGINSKQVSQLLPRWLARLLGVNLDDDL